LRVDDATQPAIQTGCAGFFAPFPRGKAKGGPPAMNAEKQKILEISYLSGSARPTKYPIPNIRFQETVHVARKFRHY